MKKKKKLNGLDFLVAGGQIFKCNPAAAKKATGQETSQCHGFHTSSQGARPQRKRRMAFSGLSGHSWTTWSFEDDPALISCTWQQTRDLSLRHKHKY